MNRLINLEHTHDIDTILGELKIGDQLVVDNGELLHRHLCGMTIYTNQLLVNTPKREHAIVKEYINYALEHGMLVGWEAGRVNKTTPSVTQYNLIAMLLQSGQMIIYRPQRSAMAIRNGNLTRQRTHASSRALSKCSLETIAGCFTDDTAYPATNPYVSWDNDMVEIPSNAVNVMQLCMTSTVDLSEQIPTASHVLNGLLYIAP